MTLSMFGRSERIGCRWDRSHVQQVFGERAFNPDSLGMFENTGCRLAAGDTRWNFLVDALSYWDPIFNILKIRPTYYCMNREGTWSDGRSAAAVGPIGRTPTGATFERVLGDIDREEEGKGAARRPHLILCATDGEA